MSEPISVGKRIKMEIHDKYKSNKQFVKQINAWLEEQRKVGRYKEQPDVLEGHLSRWLREKDPVQMRDDKIEMFADFLEVDVDYLACKQLEKHKVKPDFSKFDIDFDQLWKDVEEIKKKKPWLQLLKDKGYALDTVPTTYYTDKFQFLDDGQIITAVDSIGEDPETHIMDPEGNCYLYDDGLINDLDAYLKFRVSQLQPYDNNSSGS